MELQPMASACTEAVITAMKAVCARFGVPGELVCVNGPPFNAAKFSFSPAGTSPTIPAHPTMPDRMALLKIHSDYKHALQKVVQDGKDLFLVLMNVRSTPMDGLKSPAELLMSRKIRTLIAMNPTQLQPHNKCTEAESRLQFRQERQHRHGDKRTRPLRRTSERRKSVVSALWQVDTRLHSFCGTPAPHIRCDDTGRYHV